MKIETDMIPIGDGNPDCHPLHRRTGRIIETDMIPIGDGNKDFTFSLASSRSIETDMIPIGDGNCDTHLCISIINRLRQT